MTQLTAKVDGRPVSLDSLSWPPMNFGQFRADVPQGRYELAIPREAFVERLSPAYDQCAAELQADDCHDADAVPHLREIGYPPFAEVLDHPRQLHELVAIFLYEDVFAEFLPRPSSAPKFLLNSVDEVVATETSVILRGQGYARDRGE